MTPFLRRAGIMGNAGLAFCVDSYADRLAIVKGIPKPRYDVVGIRWSISDWLDRAKSLDTDAIRLGSLMRTNLQPNDPLLAAFQGWLAAWYPLYNTYVGPDASTLSQANVSLNYDRFNAELIRRKAEFDSISQDYNTAVSKAGAPSTMLFRPAAEMAPSNSRDGSGLPWWFWLAVTGGVGVAGYAMYKKYRSKLGFSRDKEPAFEEPENETHDTESEADDDDIVDYEVIG